MYMETLDILKTMKDGLLDGIFFNIGNVKYRTEIISLELYKEEC